MQRNKRRYVAISHVRPASRDVETVVSQAAVSLLLEHLKGVYGENSLICSIPARQLKY